MLQNEKNSAFKQKHLILFAPLDWGWGHTTRCIPLMRAFQHLGCQILVACNSIQKRIIEAEIYGARYLYLEGYNIEYGSTRLLTRLKIFAQLNKILMKVNEERRFLSDLLDKEHLTAIVSDNRYGLSNDRIPSVFITHQLQPCTGFGAAADAVTREFLYRFVNRFTQCWVPDQREPSLAGSLSHPAKLPGIPVNYIGPVSRIQTANLQNKPDIDVLILLSGPEPQRSIFEKKVVDELAQSFSKVLTCALVRGVAASSASLTNVPAGVIVHNQADAGTIATLISRSRVVVCRSGYTSLMELVAAQKKMILVPTPGQTEQEYLAKYFEENNYAITMSQQKFSLASALKLMEEKFVKPPLVNFSGYENAVSAFLQQVIV